MEFLLLLFFLFISARVVSSFWYILYCSWNDRVFTLWLIRSTRATCLLHKIYSIEARVIYLFFFRANKKKDMKKKKQLNLEKLCNLNHLLFHFSWRFFFCCIYLYVYIECLFFFLVWGANVSGCILYRCH